MLLMVNTIDKDIQVQLEQASYPARVFKGMRMAGQTGNARVKVENLQIMKVITDRNLILVNGSVPGLNNSYITIEK